MSETMVERVARAILRANMLSRGDFGTPEEVAKFMDDEWRDAVPEALAALKAMREPTAVMIGAVRSAPRNQNTNWPPSTLDFVEHYCTAIDAAIHEAENAR